jgi:glycosyltransferase involved in cell wall biosynthesis
VATRAAILLSTYNGERFLREQLDSLLRQSCQDWTLVWRDDGSTDGTVGLMRDFLAELGAERAVVLPTTRRQGAAASYLTLLRAATAAGFDRVAFADQDDVWLPEKLQRAMTALDRLPPDAVGLYWARQMLVDARLRRICPSMRLQAPPGFPAALTQNVATGCTLVLTRPAAELVAGSWAPAATLHDWWCYLVVAAAGGRMIADDTPVVLYRQHHSNLVGAPSSLLRRGVAALGRGPTVFMNVLRQNVAVLLAQPALLSEPAREQLAVIADALKRSRRDRIAALRVPGLVRQTRLETMLFRVWFLLG